MDIKLYGRKEDFDKIGKENAIIVANHRSDIDWLIGWVMAERAGVLGVNADHSCYCMCPLHVEIWVVTKTKTHERPKTQNGESKT